MLSERGGLLRGGERRKIYKGEYTGIYMKKQVMTSIDEEIHNKAREFGFNISEIVEEALKKKIQSKKNLPEENLTVKCSLCSLEIKEGFYCKESELVLCQECQNKFNMDKCKPYYERIDGVYQHIHQKWPSEILTSPNLKT